MTIGLVRLIALVYAHGLHQQKTFRSGRNGSVRVDALRQSRQRHPGGRLLRARRQYQASRCTSPSDRSFAVSSSDSARAFSDAPESTCSYGGAFRTLRDLTIRMSNFGAAETAAQLCGRLGAGFSKQWFLGFHKHKAFRLSYLSVLQSQDSLPHNMACIIQVSLYIYIRSIRPRRNS